MAKPSDAPQNSQPAEAPEPDEEEAVVEAEDLDPKPEGSTPSGQTPKPPFPEDLEPGLDYPFVWHGYSWFKGPCEILAGDRWIRRKASG